MHTSRESLERDRLARFMCWTADDRENPPVGVLLSDQIAYYAQRFKLVDPFNEQNLKPAGYELTIGDEYTLGGNTRRLNGRGELRIPPFNVAVIKTAETINLPRFLIARWNIRVRLAYQGLLWVGGPQVDPGWVGHLSCPIYNLSDQEVVLRAGDSIALMDFVTTSAFSDDCKQYKRPPKRVLLEQYGAQELKSALFTEAKERIDATQDRIDSLEKKMETFAGVFLVIIALLFAVLSVFTTFDEPTLVPVWPNVSVLISIGAFFLAFLAYRKSKSRR